MVEGTGLPAKAMTVMVHRRVVITAVIIIQIIFFVILLTLPSNAHSWYTIKRDPIFKTTTCCGGGDCAPLPEASIRITPQGLHVFLTLEQAQAINPRRTEPFDELIDFDRIQPSEDGRPHICLQPQKTTGDARNGFYCIFLPPNG